MKRLKNWLYYYITHRMSKDPAVIAALYSALQRERLRLEKIAADAKAAKFDSVQRERAAQYDKEKAETQSRCHHLKGGRIPGPGKDYAIMYHTFADGHSEIRCLLCRKIWKGEQIMSDEVRYMLDHTSNTHSSSEIFGARDRKEPALITDQRKDFREPRSLVSQIREQVNAWYKRKQEKLLEQAKKEKKRGKNGPDRIPQ